MLPQSLYPIAASQSHFRNKGFNSVSNFSDSPVLCEPTMKGTDMMAWLLFYHIATLLISLQDGSATDFNDLGKLLLGGFALAIACAIAFTFVRLRLRDKKPPASNFISISQEKK